MQQRLPKAQRREQLLETAMTIVREQGTDALTLGYLAERAGISKPIAYTHFETRAGLLTALAKQIDDRALVTFQEACQRSPKKLKELARVAATAYMHCYTTSGPEWHAIWAALKGDAETDGFQQEMFDRYANVYFETFGPFSQLPKDELHLRCIGIVGAAEGMSREMLSHRITEATASSTLASLIVKWLG
ncbi:TetR/AcrR family transcriptional regulator [Pendulispora rubella]|uniref:TetR/AcrR family transcriptional regulator n=1 Tax=Pendulispora rubella TaxID=2741070 RepID=A0ABZ2KWR1_9BACT